LDNLNTIILRYRIASGLSQEELAVEIGMSRSSYNRIESGQWKLSLDELVRLVKVLEIPKFRLLRVLKVKPNSDLDISLENLLESDNTQDLIEKISVLINELRQENEALRNQLGISKPNGKPPLS